MDYSKLLEEVRKMFELFLKYKEVRFFMWCFMLVLFLFASGYFIQAVKWW